MIKIFSGGPDLLLEYTPLNGLNWIYDAFLKDEKITIRKTFTFEKNDLHNYKTLDESRFKGDRIVFIIGRLQGEYYKLSSKVLSLDINLYIKSNIKINDKMFTSHRNISIFKKINAIVKEDIYIGDDVSDLPISVFEELVASFPNSNELNKYTNARVSSILRDYFDKSVDGVTLYENYINHKTKTLKKDNLINLFSNQEYEKYRFILQKLVIMLKNESNYSEKQWQNSILEIIQLIYPKYIKVFEEVSIKDVYNNKTKRLDYMLISSNGNIDIIEIKKPFGQSIVSENKYRDNFIPMRELSGSVMQIEKYIYYLNKWGREGEEKLTERYKEQLPVDLNIKIVNPGGIIIMGRENKLSSSQIDDFEVIKRKYKNVIDIITYDEMIARLEHIIYKFRK